MATVMTERILANGKRFRVVDTYLGFQLYRWRKRGTFHAKATWEGGPVLGADTLPTLRKLIWRWWHLVS